MKTTVEHNASFTPYADLVCLDSHCFKFAVSAVQNFNAGFKAEVFNYKP
jgi:hypothetical protein